MPCTPAPSGAPDMPRPSSRIRNSTAPAHGRSGTPPDRPDGEAASRTEPGADGERPGGAGEGPITTLVLVGVFQLFTAPVAAHMVGRAAYRAGLFRRDLLLTDELAADRGGHRRAVRPHPDGDRG